MKIITWNVNSVHARLRKPTFGEGKPSDHVPLIVSLTDG
jgi:exonuclease III